MSIDIKAIRGDKNRYLCFITALILLMIGTFSVFADPTKNPHPIELGAFIVGLLYFPFESEIWQWVYEKERMLNALAYPGFEETSLTVEQWLELSIDERLRIWEMIWDADN